MHNGRSPRIIGYGKRGPIWLCQGGAPEGEGDDDNDTGTGSTGQDDGGDDDTSGDDDADKSKGDPRIKELSDENARRRNEAKDLKRRLEESDAELKKLKAKDQTELENAVTERDELNKKVETLIEVNRRLSVENALLSHSKHKWHDPSDVVTHLLRPNADNGIEIGDDGEVTGVEAALDKLAKAKKHWIKADDDSGSGSSGSPVGSGNDNKGKPTRADIEKKFPALRGR